MESAVTTVGDGKHTGLPSSATLIQLLVSASRLIESAPPEAVSSASVSVPTSSPDEAQELADFAEQLASEYLLAVAVELAGGRLRVNFRRLPTGPGAVSGC